MPLDSNKVNFGEDVITCILRYSTVLLDCAKAVAARRFSISPTAALHSTPHKPRRHVSGGKSAGRELANRFSLGFIIDKSGF